MIWLILGMVLWFIPHSIKPIFPTLRQKISNRMGAEKSKGLFALLILTSLVFIVYGWRHSDPALSLYTPPTELYVPSLALNILSIYLFASSSAGLRYRKWIRHPQLLATVLLSSGHLLTNGEVRSIILFAGFAIWALITIPFVNHRDGAYKAPVLDSIKTEVKFIVITLIVCAFLTATHGLYSAIPLINF